jgi:hypothetical protein
MVKFGPAALVPLLARGREAKSKSMLVFMLVFAAVCAALVLPFIPSGAFGGFRVFWDQTIGYQLHRSSPFSIWGLHPSFKVALPVVKAASIALALIVAVSVPRRRSTVQVAAFSAAILVAVQMAATYWFYFYIVWFAPLVLFALFTRHGTVTSKPGRREVGRFEAAGLLNVQDKSVEWERSPALPRASYHGVS